MNETVNLKVRDIPSWRMGAREMGWLLPALVLAVVAGGLLMLALDRRANALFALVVSYMLPLAGGVGGGLLFAPDEEPSLELLLSKPRANYWLLLERAGVLLAVLTGIGLLGTGVLAALVPQIDPMRLIADWFVPMLALGGVGMAMTFFMRRASAGVLIVLLLLGGMALGGDMLIARFPFLWPLHLMAQSWTFEPTHYVINRIVWLAIGVWAASLALRAIADEERLLSSRRGA